MILQFVTIALAVLFGCKQRHADFPERQGIEVTHKWYDIPLFERPLPGFSDDEIDELAVKMGWEIPPEFRLYLRHVNGAFYRRRGYVMAVEDRFGKSVREREHLSELMPEVDFFNWPPQDGKNVGEGTILEVWNLQGVGQHEKLFSLDDPLRKEFCPRLAAPGAPIRWAWPRRCCLVRRGWALGVGAAFSQRG